jgi:hypothetical protein
MTAGSHTQVEYLALLLTRVQVVSASSYAPCTENAGTVEEARAQQPRHEKRNRGDRINSALHARAARALPMWLCCFHAGAVAASTRAPFRLGSPGGDWTGEDLGGDVVGRETAAPHDVCTKPKGRLHEKGDSMAKAAAGADSSVADELRRLGVKGVLVQMAERGQLLDLECEMPQCYHHKGRAAFDPMRGRAPSGRPRPTNTRPSSRPAGTSAPRTMMATAIRPGFSAAVRPGFYGDVYPAKTPGGSRLSKLSSV